MGENHQTALRKALRAFLTAEGVKFARIKFSGEDGQSAFEDCEFVAKLDDFVQREITLTYDDECEEPVVETKSVELFFEELCNEIVQRLVRAAKVINCAGFVLATGASQERRMVLIREWGGVWDELVKLRLAEVEALRQIGPKRG